MLTNILRSDIDRSINYIHDFDGYIYESRYIKRRPDDFTCYLSSHSGCKLGCRFCYLTALKQTSFRDASVQEIYEQAKGPVLNDKDKSKQVNYSFMTRGDAIASRVVQQEWSQITTNLAILAPEKTSTFHISTIMPKRTSRLSTMFKVNQPQIYYSLYSTYGEFRAKWMPGAMSWQSALEELKEYQDSSQKIIKIHGSVIAGENDQLSMWHSIVDYIEEIGLIATIQFVQFNPPPGSEYKQSELLGIIAGEIRRRIPTRIIDRVGPDVYASCGMFIED